jgi:DNA-binding NarL/FixJ family response regulator
VSFIRVDPLEVLIADDHGLVRAGFRALLENIAGLKVVAEAQNGHEAWKLIRRLRPALALVDISMPVLNGLELTARVAAKQPSTRVIVLSMHATKEYFHRAVRAGAAGYLLKDTSPADLERAIRAVNRGETYFHLAARSRLAPAVGVRRGEPAGLDILTPRQREILQLIGEGYSTKAIAKLLGISFKTAEAHRSQLRARLGLHDVAAVVRYAIAAGLVDPE